MTLLLKQLDIRGFKSFANPTTFVFDRGITAVIGPNGSGKSNVAEALRWVLGEQGYSNLRSRRTEDVIFAGSDKRAQMSMAEVVLTLDNRDGDLPLAFSEITIARRAFRSGESQYLINGGRVRLKDIQQLVAPLGQSYTIIGQGLVDAALSQRPEERRGLFEHAAGISGLRLRATEAERSLAESSANAQRMRDILSELEPRVRSLERSARLAREYGNVRDRLHLLQRRFYGHLWGESLRKLASTRAAMHEAEQTHQEHDRLHDQASRRLSTLRSEERRLSDEHRHITEAVLSIERELADARHQRALLDARVNAAADRRTDLERRIEELQREATSAAEDATNHDRDADATRAEIAALESRLAEQSERAEQARRRRSELRDALAANDRRSVEISRELAQIDGALNSGSERLSTHDQERDQLTQRSASEQERLAEIDATIAALTAREPELRRQLTALDDSLRACVETINATTRELESLRQQRQQLEREITGQQTRLDVLNRAHASGEGFYAGVRSLLRAINRRELDLPGLIGTVAETVDVPSDLEVAIEVALGGHLQDLIVAEWADAQAAIAYLRKANAGRATFQPLDTVRPGRRPALNARDHDLIGIAADQVNFPDQVRPVIEQLLGRTLVVTNLDASRRLLSSAPGWTLVTLSGDITRPSGSVTGGARTAEAGILARERERRSLPKTIADGTRRRDATVADIARVEAAIRGAEAERDRLRASADEHRLSLRDLETEIERQQRLRTEAEHAVATTAERIASLGGTQDRIQSELAQLDQRRGELQSEHQRLQTERAAIEAAIEAEPDGEQAETAALHAEIATLRERLRSLESAATRLRQLAATAERNATARVAEIDTLAATVETDERERQAFDQTALVLERKLLERRAAVTPIASQREEITETLAKAERDLQRAAERLRETERERDRASLQLARVQDEQVFLTERIRSDLELADPAVLEEDLDDGDMPDEQEIARLRERLRRMSNVGEDVVEQHEAESQRLAYLTEQLADIDTASDGLRRVLAELNEKMSSRFTETFREVAVAFEQTFTRLFGGGTARLVMNPIEDGVAGIDIVAQPPGKRLQNLNALSGGERALTAVALLIAIQRVNPSPFCLLDEVDAALDESNVVRFRDELRDLSGSTQYVIITHNRGTIEGADTLYGVTMGDDGISRVLSLRLEEAIAAVESYETAQSAG